MTIYIIRRLLAVWILLFAAGAFVRGATPDYNHALSAGKALTEKGRHAEAFQTLQAAVTASPARFEAYFELAVVSYRMGSLTAAEEYAKLALERAPETEQARIRETLAVIGEKREFEQLERAGDEAYGNGLMAKAAESYRKAYLLFPNHGKVGLRAASIYAETMGRLLDAALLWQKIAAGADTPSAAAAREELKRRAGELARLTDARLTEAKQSGNIAQLLQLTELAPRKLEYRLELAAAYAAKSDVANTIRHLAEANKLGLKSSVAMQRTEFVALLNTSGPKAGEFSRFLVDAFGDDVAKAMRVGGNWNNPVGKNVRIPDLALDLIWLPSGTFTLGSGIGDEKPALQVSLSGSLWMGKTEVTQAQWQAVMRSNPSHFRGNDRPVEKVSWSDAMEFCRKLTARERGAGRLSSKYEYTLPTEAQWEYACRAGTTGEHAGAPLAAHAWFKDNASNAAQPVARKKANRWGLHDMHGNVWEWCRDWYRADYGGYPGGTKANNPIGPASGTARITRGGSWNSPVESCRSANRNRNDPTFRHSAIGFRVVLRTVRKTGK